MPSEVRAMEREKEQIKLARPGEYSKQKQETSKDQAGQETENQKRSIENKKIGQFRTTTPRKPRSKIDITKLQSSP